MMEKVVAKDKREVGTKVNGKLQRADENKQYNCTAFEELRLLGCYTGWLVLVPAGGGGG
jgi:hypothetical protein